MSRAIIGSKSAPAFWYTGEPNFGDMISPFILGFALDIEPILVRPKFAGKLLGAGSILNRAVPGDHVWGSGLIQAERFDGRGIQFSAVRGPRTRSLVDGDVPENYGDPGILLPLLYEPIRGAPRFDVGLVPHFVDKDTMSSSDARVLVVDIQHRNWRRTIDQITSCDVVISSSLHGIIAAEAYGVPAVWVEPSDRVKGGGFKFHDYYEGTGRDAVRGDWNRGLRELVGIAAAPPALKRDGLMSALKGAE